MGPPKNNSPQPALAAGAAPAAEAAQQVSGFRVLGLGLRILEFGV